MGHISVFDMLDVSEQGMFQLDGRFQFDALSEGGDNHEKHAFFSGFCPALRLNGRALPSSFIAVSRPVPGSGGFVLGYNGVVRL